VPKTCLACYSVTRYDGIVRKYQLDIREKCHGLVHSAMNLTCEHSGYILLFANCMITQYSCV